ncbi:MAG: hypothetical protein WCA95_14780 [Opitutaceae bacterium]
MVPQDYLPVVRQSILATGTNPKVGIEWTTYAKCSGGCLASRLPCWYTCLIRNDSGGSVSFPLYSIGAQCREARVLMRISGATSYVLTPPSPVPPPTQLDNPGPVPNGFILVEGIPQAECKQGGRPSANAGQNTYILSFEGAICFIECYVDALWPTEEAKGGVHVLQIEDGYPPAGSPGALN